MNPPVARYGMRFAPRRWFAFLIAYALIALVGSQPSSPAMRTAATDQVTGLSGYQDASGAWVIAPQFRSAGDFDHGLALVDRADGSSLLIDEHGNTVRDGVEAALWVSLPTMTEAKFNEDLLALRDQASGKVGFVDAQGHWIIRPRFVDAFEFHEGLAAVRLRKDGPVGFVDRRGRMVIAAKFGTRFRSPPRFSEGLAAVGLNDLWPRTNLDPPGKLGYIDRRGRWVIAPIYSNGEDFANGRARVWQGEREIEIKRPAR
ncbi:MAG: WG repeat-containing protein [Burkholderiales bacterium]|nr:WG repeat-containing protein [Burkholderiales bacterium]